ncbi:MAG: PBSX family phage terminase large subunit [Muribaculum sp.]|nr:PBSX family phage terminase large subunit [Muribaculum sp.]
MKRAAEFKFSKFSLKQRIVLEWWMPQSPYAGKDGIICDGAIRSGKTTAMGLSFVLWAMETFNGENLAICGKTVQSARRNIIAPLKRQLQSIGYRIVEHRSENYLEIFDGRHKNCFFLFGGKDEGSQDLIQGITLAGLLLDEVALMPESFVNQATARCSVRGSKIWFNCNPEGPDHYFKTKWIDCLAEKNLIRIHFTMLDNLSLSKEVLERYERRYKGVFYDRFIQGLWVLASGLIFRYFAEDDAPYLFKDEEVFAPDGRVREGFSKLVMGIDFGGSGSKTTFCLSGYQQNYHLIRVLEEDSLPLTDDIDAAAICRKFIEFYIKCVKSYGRVDWIFPDSASPTMINSLISAAKEAGLRHRNIAGCTKNEVAERPKMIDLLLNTGRLKINQRCTNIRKAIASLRWDEDHPDRPEDKNIGNCNDWWDCLCYTMLTFKDFIELDR